MCHGGGWLLCHGRWDESRFGTRRERCRHCRGRWRGRVPCERAVSPSWAIRSGGTHGAVDMQVGRVGATALPSYIHKAHSVESRKIRKPKTERRRPTQSPNYKYIQMRRRYVEGRRRVQLLRGDGGMRGVCLRWTRSSQRLATASTGAKRVTTANPLSRQNPGPTLTPRQVVELSHSSASF